MIKKIGVLIAGVVLLMSTSSFALAQETEDTEFLTGVVTEVTDSQINVMAGEEEEEKSEWIFAINEETVLEEMTGINDINLNDEVFIDYAVVGTENVALNIYKFDLEEMNAEEGEEAMDEMDAGDEYEMMGEDVGEEEMMGEDVGEEEMTGEDVGEEMEEGAEQEINEMQEPIEK